MFYGSTMMGGQKGLKFRVLPVLPALLQVPLLLSLSLSLSLSMCSDCGGLARHSLVGGGAPGAPGVAN